MKRIGVLKKGSAIFAAAVVAFTGCGTSSQNTATAGDAASEESVFSEESTEAPKVDSSRKTTLDGGQYDKVTIGLQDDPADLSPTGYGAYSHMIVSRNFYETLFDLENNEYVPVLAKGYTEVDDLHWDVEIYDYITDTDGNNITADDVVFSYQLLIDSGKAAKYDYFENVEAIDTYTVEFTWSKPVDAVGALEWPWCRTNIVSQKAYEEGNFTSAPKGTGPYDVTEYVVGSHLTLTAKDNYWQTDELRNEMHQANVKTIEYDVIAETSQHVIGLGTGQLQYSQYVPAENITDFESNGQYDEGNAVYITQGSALEVLMANCTEGKITADSNFRKALWYAIDNDSIATATGTYIAAHALGTPFFGDYDSSWENMEGNYMASMDVDKAKEYLEMTDYDGETLVIMGTSDEATKSAMTMIQALLTNVGINVEIKAEDGVMLEDDMLNSDEWDILYKDCGGGSQVGEWNRFVNYNEFGTDVNMAFIHDEELQSLYETANSIDGHNSENMTTFIEYVLDNGYYYAACSPRISAVYSDCFATLAYSEGEFFRPGACVYYLD